MKRQTIKRLVRLLLPLDRPLRGRFSVRPHTTIRPPPQRQRFPRFSAVAAVRFPASPSSRCSKAVLWSGRIPQRQRFLRFSAGAVDWSWGGDRVSGTCVSCAAILQCPAYHQKSFRLLSRTYVLTTCRTRHIPPPNGHSAPYPHKSSRCLFPEHLIIRYFCKRALLDVRYASTPEVWLA